MTHRNMELEMTRIVCGITLVYGMFIDVQINQK